MRLVIIVALCLALGGCELPVLIHYLTCGDEPCHPPTPR